jgi:hypothetical protein
MHRGISGPGDGSVTGRKGVDVKEKCLKFLGLHFSSGIGSG